MPISLPFRSSSSPVRAATAVLALCSLAGCAAVGPDYTPPQTPMPSTFVGLAADGRVATTQDALAPGAIARWWETLNDPTLTSLIERAIAQNLDLQLARARLREAYALRGIERSRLYPTVDAAASASRSRASETTGQPGIGQDDENRFAAGLDASWELDIFGGIRRGIEASDAELMVAEEDERFVLVSLAAEVAQTYVDLRQFQQRKDVIARGIRTQRDTVDLTRSRLDAGLAADLEVAQSQAQLATRQSQRPPLLTGERAAMYRLAVLLGVQPGELVAELAHTEPVVSDEDAPGTMSDVSSIRIPRAAQTIAAGLPSDLLRRRPDVRRAERRIASATARVGVATADLFPRFSLTGSFGLQSEELDPLFDLSSRTWSIGPSVRWNVFDARRIRRSIDAATEREQQALISYQQTVLTALEDVENALTRLANEQTRNAALTDAVAANRRAVNLADERYRSGVGDFLNVLETQRQLYDTEDALVQSDAEVSRAVIALYRALGGGWQESMPATDEAPVQSEHR